MLFSRTLYIYESWFMIYRRCVCMHARICTCCYCVVCISYHRTLRIKSMTQFEMGLTEKLLIRRKEDKSQFSDTWRVLLCADCRFFSTVSRQFLCKMIVVDDCCLQTNVCDTCSCKSQHIAHIRSTISRVRGDGWRNSKGHP